MSSTNETSDGVEQSSEESDAGPAESTLVETRRNAAKFFAAIGGAAAVGSFAVTGLTGIWKAGGVEGGEKLTYKNIYVKGTRLVDKQGNPIKVGRLEEGSGEKLTVYPEKEGGGALEKKLATTVLVRYSEDAYKKPTNLDSTVQGYAAYSAVCTHAGCIASGREGQNLSCPCHGSLFDPLQGAKVVGGPASKPLPQLPLGTTEDGQLLVATGHFEAPLGPP